MKIFLPKNVFDAALERTRWLFDEFEEVIVMHSGGKDSTVIFNLAMMVAKEKNRLPLRVAFLDQEAEWECVIEHMRAVMYRQDVLPMWHQIPLFLGSGVTLDKKHRYLHCWEEGKEWLRDKDPISIKTEGPPRHFYETLNSIGHDIDAKVCRLGGVRAQESPGRFLGMTQDPTYKHATWGRIDYKNKKNSLYTFYPIYDWHFEDVWKSIHDNKWPYCKLYDYYYQYGMPITRMRVSSVHHEQAIGALFVMQEIEPALFDKMVTRLPGVSAASHLKWEGFSARFGLPHMFTDWKEYRDYLLEHLVTDGELKAKYAKTFKRLDSAYAEIKNHEALYRIEITTLLCNDHTMVKIHNYENRTEVLAFTQYKREGRVPRQNNFKKATKLFPPKWIREIEQRQKEKASSEQRQVGAAV